MDSDNYQYQIKPLPKPSPVGGASLTGGSLTMDAQVPQLESSFPPTPFDNGDFPSGSGGTTPVTPTGCADDIKAGSLATSGISFPCDGTPVAVVLASNLTQDDGAGNTAQLSANAGLLSISNGSESINAALSDLPSGGVAQFRSFTLCDGTVTYILCTEPTTP